MEVRTKAPYSAPLHKVIENHDNQSVHQPNMPFLVKLMGLSEWQQEIHHHTMSPKGVAAAGKVLTRMDKTMAVKRVENPSKCCA